MVSKYLFLLCTYFVLSGVSCTTHPFNGRIFGGQLAKPGQFPFIVSIQEDIDDRGIHGHYCGGSILNNQWIVTAGHCIAAPALENYQIIAGTNLIDTGGFIYNVTKTIQHPQFNITAIANDIALIKIDGEFTFTDTVASIEIGESSGNESSTALGWGQTENEESPNELRFIEVTALSVDNCKTLAEGGHWNDMFPPGDENVCAISSEGKGVCYGDSGSSLVYNDRLIGIASYLLDGDCASKYPDVFTRADYYKEWIETTIATN